MYDGEPNDPTNTRDSTTSKHTAPQAPINGASCNLHTLHIAQEISSTVLTLHSLQHSVQE